LVADTVRVRCFLFPTLSRRRARAADRRFESEHWDHVIDAIETIAPW
jgi:hypothetical protein